MSNKKARFLVKVDGELREIFSVQEGSTGGLTIALRGADHQFRHGPADIDRNAQVVNRISVHPSDKSALSGTTIVRTLITDNGDEERASAFVKNSKKNLLWHAHSCLCPDLRNPRYDRSNPKQSRSVVVAEDAPKLSSLIFHIFVASVRRPPTYFPFYRSTECDFTRFRIVVYACYLNLPTSHISTTATSPTLSPVINGKPYYSTEDFLKSYPDGALSLQDDEIYYLIHTLNQKLYDGYVAVLATRSPALASALPGHKPVFSYSPLSPDQPVILFDDQPPRWQPRNQS